MFPSALKALAKRLLFRMPVLKEFFGSSTLRNVAIKEWAARGYSSPSPHFVKQSVVLRNGIPGANWVETGTYLGDTTALLAMHSPRVITIEPDPALHANAEIRFKNYPNIELIQGISEEIFPKLIPGLEGEFCFWLDGHYSAGVTHKGPNDTPIRYELAEISKNLANFRQLVVMVDDIRCFDPRIQEYSTYPSKDYLVEWAAKNNLSWTIEHDIFIAKTN
jgi:hypothetical protein